MISREVVDEIIARNDIESLIGSYVSLKRAGINLKGLCPFHSEKTPSFTVYPQDNSFYCFGCGIGGNAVTFIRQIEHLDYPDAIEFLAKKAGITVLRDENDTYNQSSGIRKDRLLKMNVDAARFFHIMLMADNPDSKACLKYFMQDRGLELSTIKHFGLGYAPNSYDAMLKYMISKGYTPDELVEGYFVVKSKTGKYIDAFRNRCMYPIFDVAGNVIAFGGRRLDPNDPTKYRNTMDTVVYKKSRHIYGLNFAKNSSQDYIILTEGYHDSIMPNQAGITNIVSSLGTALTIEQARLLSRYTKKVYICFDSDEAGQKATARAIRIFDEVGLESSIIVIPGEKDPDDFVRQNGKEKFLKLIEGSKSKFEYGMDNILSKYNLEISQDRINALGELEKLISETYSKAERDVYIQIVAERLKVEIKSVRDDVDKIIRKNLALKKKKDNEALKNGSFGYLDRVNPDYARAPGVAANEEVVLALLLLYPEHRKKVFSENLLSTDDFFTEFNISVFEYTEIMDNEEAPDINEAFTPEQVGRITQIKHKRMGLENGIDVLIDSIKMLKASIEKKNTRNITTIDALAELINKKRND